jgi:hypothetical protein
VLMVERVRELVEELPPCPGDFPGPGGSSDDGTSDGREPDD